MMAFSKFAGLLAILSLITIVIAVPSISTTQACQSIDTALPGRLSWPLEIAYINETQEYWSTALRDLQPACVVHPTTTAEVASVVQILNNYTDVDFAIKSGGHDPNPGHGSIQDGVLIAMRLIAGATYDASTGLALVKPGGDWDTVIGDLAPYGVTVVGGRLGIVGVGGYLLQGGVSFLSAQYGLAADNIVGWETVMPNGTIVNVDAAIRPDLAVAMRGSGSQFGIVTQFTVKAHAIGEVWGGIRAYSDLQRTELYAALHNFVPNGVDDPKAAIIFTDIIALADIPVIIVFYCYDGDTAPTSGPFADFLSISYLIDSTSTQAYSDILSTNGDESALLEARISFRTFTIPYVASNPGIYQQIHDQYNTIAIPYLANPLNLLLQCSLDFQPFPSLIGSHSEAAGGNAMGLSSSDPDRILLEFECAWEDAAEDELMYTLTQQMTDWMETQMPSWLAEAGLDAESYMPYFMNDAMGDQNVTGMYKGYEAFKTLQAEVDPDGMFRTRAGGFKY